MLARSARVPMSRMPAGMPTTKPATQVEPHVSIAVTDAFMRAVEHDGEWELVHKTAPEIEAQANARKRIDGMWIYRTVRARDLWDQVMRSTYDHAEPGIVFIDRINTDDNLSYCERLDATNPCGEQPLPPYGACLLGSINLARLVKKPFAKDASLDEGRLDEIVPLEPAAMAGRTVVQWDKDDCADLGIIKVDMLGLGMMAVLEEAVPLVEKHEGRRIDLAHLDGQRVVAERGVQAVAPLWIEGTEARDAFSGWRMC